MGDAAASAYRSRVRVVSGQWRRKIQFATPQAESAILGAIDQLSGLMNQPMVIDGEPVTDDRDRPVSRRRFWSLAQADEALALAAPDEIDGIETLEELADILFLARFEPQILSRLYQNRAFIVKCATLRDEDKNTILHWVEAADLPRKILHGLMAAMRTIADDANEGPGERNAARAALVAENREQVKLHEIAFALKDDALARELMHARVSVREPNRAGENFVDEALRVDSGEEYLRRLRAIAAEDRIPEAEADLEINESDQRRARLIAERDDLLDDLVNQRGKLFRSHLNDALKVDAGRGYELFFADTAREAAKKRGRIIFGRLDRLGRDWLWAVLQHGDGELLDRCLTLIARRVDDIAEVFVTAKPELTKDDVARQVMRVYLKTPSAEKKSLLAYAVETRKAFFVKRVLESALYPPHEVTAERDGKRRDAMRNRNMAMLAGQRCEDNLFLQAAMLETAQSGVDEDSATTMVMKILEVMFEPLDDEQGLQLFKRYYAFNDGSETKDKCFYDFIFEDVAMLPRVKESLLFYAEMYMAE